MWPLFEIPVTQLYAKRHNLTQVQVKGVAPDLIMSSRHQPPPPPLFLCNDRFAQRPPCGQTALLLTLLVEPRSCPTTTPCGTAPVYL